MEAETSWSAIERGDVAYVVRRFWGPVHTILRARLPQDEAADATQEFFLRFLERNLIERIDASRGRCRSLIYHAARQFVIDRLRQRARDPLAQPLPAEAADLAQGDLPAEDFDREWFRSLIDQARRAVKTVWVGRGKDAAYYSFRLHYFGGGGRERWRRGDIAGRLELTEIQVNNYIHRGQKLFAGALRDLVADTCGPDHVEEEFTALRRFIGDPALLGAPPSSAPPGAEKAQEE